MSGPVVHLLHCVDTEGPLWESAEETVARFNGVCGMSLPPTRATLEALRRGDIDVGDHAPVVETLLKLAKFLGDWGSIERMLDHAGSREFRLANGDSFGRPYRYNFHVMDHIGYEVNPRRRDIGFGNVFDFYERWIRETESEDQLGFHFHPEHFYKHAHMSGTSYDPARWLHEVLARRVIDRGWFPKSYRAGFHTERPDSHAFLEQWIPHDFSNQSMESEASTAGQLDVDAHRFGDWIRAPKAWGWYHPHHDDYQAVGQCRRRIFRCLNVASRVRSIDRFEVDKAFRQAKESGGPVWAMVTDHDFRDLAPDVRWVKESFDAASKEHGVPWRSGSIDDTFEPWRGPPPKCEWHFETKGRMEKLHISYSEPIFGPQPYLALKLVNDLYFRANTDIHEPFRRFSYTFDEHSVPLSKVEKIVVATNDRHGNVLVDRVRDEVFR